MPGWLDSFLTRVPRADDGLCLVLFALALLVGVALGWYCRGLDRT